MADLISPAARVRKRRKQRRRTVVALVAIAAVAAIGGGIAFANTGGKGSSYRTATAGAGSVDQITTSAGTVAYVQKATASFPVAGTVSAVGVKVGQTVTAGQQIAALDTTDLESAVAGVNQTLATDQQTLASDLQSQAVTTTTAATTTPATTTAAPTSSAVASGGSGSSGSGGSGSGGSGSGGSGSGGSGSGSSGSGSSGAPTGSGAAAVTGSRTASGAPTTAASATPTASSRTGTTGTGGTGAGGSGLAAEQNKVVSLQSCVDSLLDGSPIGSPGRRTTPSKGPKSAQVDSAACEPFWAAQTGNRDKSSERELIAAETATGQANPSACTQLSTMTLPTVTTTVAAPTTVTVAGTTVTETATVGGSTTDTTPATSTPSTGTTSSSTPSSGTTSSGTTSSGTTSTRTPATSTTSSSTPGAATTVSGPPVGASNGTGAVYVVITPSVRAALDDVVSGHGNAIVAANAASVAIAEATADYRTRPGGPPSSGSKPSSGPAPSSAPSSTRSSSSGQGTAPSDLLSRCDALISAVLTSQTQVQAAQLALQSAQSALQKTLSAQAGSISGSGGSGTTGGRTGTGVSTGNGGSTGTSGNTGTRTTTGSKGSTGTGATTGGTARSATSGSGSKTGTGSSGTQSTAASTGSSGTPRSAGTGSTGTGTGSGNTSANGGTGASGGGPGGSNVTPRIATAADIAADQAQIDLDQANIAVARQSLTGAVLTSPITGVVAAVAISRGDAVKADSTSSIITILGPGQYEVTTTVGLSLIDQLKVGDKAVVMVNGITTPLTGTVTMIGVLSSSASAGSTTYPVTVLLDKNPQTLYQGSGASVAITLSKVSNVLTVPTSAVHTSGAQHTVTVLDAGQTRTVVVQEGAVGTDLTQITSGLTAGQVVVIADLDQAIATTTSATSRAGLAGLGGNANTGAGGFGGAGGGGGARRAGG